MQTRGSFRVQVAKDYLVFASAHFITFPGHRCEKLHGHNYRVAAAVEGPLTEDAWYVLDFTELKRIMRQLCDEIDHVVLLPMQNPHVRVEERGDSVHVTYDGAPRYVFPRRDCCLLPIPNTTVEMLAQHLAGRARAELGSLGLGHLTAVEIEVEENFGQSATYREHLVATDVRA
jgi:6-pyruvoyltetrahydropterin/6-carboxytetrahydropterin synthase